MPTPDRARRATRPRRWARQAFARFWVLPALWCLGAVIGGVLLPLADEGATDLAPYLFNGGADGARTVLSTIAGAMISVTGLVFSITIVVLQLASSQFSPRVLPAFLEDRITQNTLGLFAATFVYALTVLRSVDDGRRATRCRSSASPSGTCSSSPRWGCSSPSSTGSRG